MPNRTSKVIGSEPIKVLIVDDSALARRLLTEVLEGDSEIEVVGTALDPFLAREKIKKYDPDVITLDIEMPRMDGLTFLEKLMRLHPMPVVMVSSLTEKGAQSTLKAMELGAFDFVTKPKLDVREGITQFADEICRKVKAAARSGQPRVKSQAVKTLAPEEKFSADVILPKKRPRILGNTETIVVLGASTGGTEAIKHVLCGMPANSPAIMITQHIPETFSAPFAERMNRESAMCVVHAEDGMPVESGHVYIAPGNAHLMVKRSGARYFCHVKDGPPVNRHKPSVDVLFRSAAQEIGHNAIGVLLTGMGDDGARGLLEVLEAGGKTLAQDERTSVVWGMPGAADKLGAAEVLLPLNQVADAILERTKKVKLVGT